MDDHQTQNGYKEELTCSPGESVRGGASLLEGDFKTFFLQILGFFAFPPSFTACWGVGGRGCQAWLPGKSENKHGLKHFVNLVVIRYLGIFANLNILEYFKAGDIESFNRVSDVKM